MTPSPINSDCSNSDNLLQRIYRSNSDLFDFRVVRTPRLNMYDFACFLSQVSPSPLFHSSLLLLLKDSYLADYTIKAL